MIPQNPQKVKGAVSFIHIKGAPKSAFWTHFLPFTVCSWLSLRSRFFTSSNRLTAWPQTQFERKVKNASHFFRASQKIQYLFRIVYKIPIFYLPFSHRNLFAFTESARNWHTPSREHDVHTAQISSSIFYVFANCTNFHFLRNFISFWWYFGRDHGFIRGFALFACISAKTVLRCQMREPRPCPAHPRA